MHWEAVQAIVRECDAYSKGDSRAVIPAKEVLVFCVSELAAQLRRLNAEASAGGIVRAANYGTAQHTEGDI